MGRRQLGRKRKMHNFCFAASGLSNQDAQAPEPLRSPNLSAHFECYFAIENYNLDIFSDDNGSLLPLRAGDIQCQRNEAVTVIEVF